MGVEITYVVGELPYRSDQPSQLESYTCVFGMRQEVDVLRANPLPVSTTALFHDGEEGADSNGIAYITEGTNDPEKGWVSTVNGDALRPSDNTDDEDMQEWLSDKTAFETSAELWPNFIRSDDAQKNRNPWLNCVQDGECAVAGN